MDISKQVTPKMINFPKQVAPVERSLAPAAISDQSGIEASAWYDHIISGIKTALPIAANVVSHL
ncbi:MAG: hypothetical protein F6K23_21155 [Okeania sp. SIO2C9]|uniref:hypothetical protein n=1 Tax=Okeania sp. SIO2C9 TaxID=2607791 RepID=UPI0013BFC227|nr:hypothetical protein [Okeania sp. SIO2C9]NEQ75334.1 hypothetical protein [Okeania sp. SIO2C9]